jgi:hypothetical protein
MNRIKQKKSIIFLAGTFIFTFLTLFSCKNESSELTTEEKETAKKEILAQVEKIVLGAAQLNIEMAMGPYSSSTDFLVINPDGTFLNYNGMKEVNTESFKQLNSMEFSTKNEEFRFLTKNKVPLTWYGKNKFELKSGEKMKIDSYVGTMLFEKINNEWKIVYAHESTSAPQLE